MTIQETKTFESSFSTFSTQTILQLWQYKGFRFHTHTVTLNEPLNHDLIYSNVFRILSVRWSFSGASLGKTGWEERMKPWMFLVLILYRCSELKYSRRIAENMSMICSAIKAKKHIRTASSSLQEIPWTVSLILCRTAVRKRLSVRFGSLDELSLWILHNPTLLGKWQREGG